jgi:hypothetical protein
MQGIYFVSNLETEFSVIIKDFEKREKTCYQYAHILTTNKVNKD